MVLVALLQWRVAAVQRCVLTVPLLLLMLLLLLSEAVAVMRRVGA